MLFTKKGEHEKLRKVTKKSDAILTAMTLVYFFTFKNL